MADLTVEEKLRGLYELQTIDSKIDELEILKGELPMEVSDLEDEIAGLETRHRRINENVEDLEGEISRYQSNIQEAKGLIERYTKQSDNVKNNREYEALTKELEMQKLDIQLFEKKIKEANVTLEAKQETLNATQERLVAYVLGLTPAWSADYGGLLQFLDAGGAVEETFMPRYNTLTLFRVPADHCVSYVSDFCTRSRYSITGWLRRS